jgi:hypothetical protein
VNPEFQGSNVIQQAWFHYSGGTAWGILDNSGIQGNGLGNPVLQRGEFRMTENPR